MRLPLFLLLTLVSGANLFAKGTLHNVARGVVNFDNVSANHLKVQASDRAIINWKDFSVKKGDITEFVQPSSKAAVLNRVTGSNKSLIEGTLKGNGQVYLINPNGIFIGGKAVIDTAAFLASTLDVLDENFIKNSEMVFKGDSQELVINLGKIKAFDGDAILVGYQVQNKGELEAPKGLAALAAGKEVMIKPAGEERIFIQKLKWPLKTLEYEYISVC